MTIKKGQEGFGLLILGISAILLIILLIGFAGWYDYKTDLRECKDYSGYGYYTEVVGDYWDVFNGRDICLIIMEDGTKLPLNDYKTMSIKNAKIK